MLINYSFLVLKGWNFFILVTANLKTADYENILKYRSFHKAP